MKKIIFWILGIVCVAVLGLWLWSQRPGLQVEAVLPSQPLVFVRLVHVEDHVNQIINSEFGKDIAAINFPDVLSRNNFSSKDIKGFQNWQRDFLGIWQNPLIRRLLNKEAAVAVYRQGDSYQVFVIVRLTLSTRIAELFSHFSNRWSAGATFRHQRYHGRGINHIQFRNPSMGLAYVRIRDLLIFAPESLGHLEEIVDVYQHQSTPLLVDTAYQFVRQKAYPSSEGLLFVNSNLISNFWRGQMDLRLTTLGYQTAAFPVYGLSYKPGVVSKFKMIVGLDQKYFSPGFRQTFACPALANDTLKLVPVNAILYSWGGCYDFEQVWETAKDRIAQGTDVDESIKTFKHRLERHFHVNLRTEVLPLLGHEIGGYLTDIDMEGSYPFPRLLFFIKIKDKAKAEVLLNKFTDHPVTTIFQEQYNHVVIHYIALPLGANTDPGYCFLGDYLLMATSRQLLKQSIDAYDDSFHSIVSDDAVEQFSLAQGGKFHAVTLLKTAELSRRAQDFLGWIDKYLSGRISMAAIQKQNDDNQKLELDEVIADKSAELILAQKKLNQLKSNALTIIPVEDPDVVNGAIENLNRETDALRDDIAKYKEDKEDLSRQMDNYVSGAQSDKLTMYNMDNVLSPVLKGLESIDAQAVTVRFDNKVLETEFLVK